ncbi:unnamed protein product [Gadus morhua 'NCC']
MVSTRCPGFVPLPCSHDDCRSVGRFPPPPPTPSPLPLPQHYTCTTLNVQFETTEDVIGRPAGAGGHQKPWSFVLVVGTTRQYPVLLDEVVDRRNHTATQWEEFSVTLY